MTKGDKRRRRKLLKNLPPPQQTTSFLSPPDAQVKEQPITPAEPEDPQDSGKMRVKQAIGKSYHVISTVTIKALCARAGKSLETLVPMHMKS